MKEWHQVVRKPLITEKSTRMKEAENQIAFVVDSEANKVQIRQAVEKLFKVKVKSVRTMNLVGKRKRMGKFWGWKSDWKKAIVKIEKGQTIDKFGEA